MYKQSGFALIQLIIVSIIVTVIAIWGAQGFVNQLNDFKAQSAAQWMLTIQNSASNYLHTYSQELKKAKTNHDLQSHGFVNWSNPSLDELKLAGLLSNNINTQNRTLGNAKIIVIRQGDCTTNNCNLDAIVVLDKPVLDINNKINLAFITPWLLNTKGRGAVVYPEHSNKLLGQLFEYNNPINNEIMLEIGTVALGLTSSALASDKFLTIKDERDPDFQNDLSLGSDLNVGKDAHIKGSANVDDDLNLAGDLYFNSASQWLSTCNAPNAITRDNYYGLLVCLGGAWQTVGRSPGAYSMNSKFGCANNSGLSTSNPVTGDCSCPLGYHSIQVSEGSTGLAGDGITYGYVCVL